MVEKLRVLLVEDHRMFADGVRMLLDEAEGMEWVGTASRGDEAVRLCTEECPDVILMDIELPGMDGVEATRRVRDLCPRAAVIALTALEADAVLTKAFEAGACGFVPKTQAAEDLIDAIRRAAAGEIVLPEGEVAPLLERLQGVRRDRSDARRLLDQLSDREIEILQALADGYTVPEIANRLFISPHTVHTHVRSILAKLSAHSKLEAVLFALRHGAIHLRPNDGTGPDR